MTDEDLSYAPGPWPASGDHLIVSGGDGHHNAWIPGYGDPFAHIEGYKRAGDLVWVAIEPNPRAAGIDYLVYPMIFLYRHFVELSLKDIIATGSHLEGGPGAFPAGHGLSELWAQARCLIERIEGAYVKSDLDAMAPLIAEFARIDGGGTAFRYPLGRDGNPSLPGIQTLDLAAFHQGIEKMAAFFDGCRSQFGEYERNLG